MDAQAAAPLFQHPGHEGLLWIPLVVVAAAAPAIAIALVGLVRGRLPRTTAFVGLALLPVFAFTLGNFLLMERAQKTSFCGSCHVTMGPLVESLKSGEDNLAAFHYTHGAVPTRESCYTCHSGYGIWGDVQAKSAGFAHMWNTLTRGYEFPLEMRGPFDIAACLQCHAESRRFRAVEVHADPGIQEALLAREMSCVDCHLPAHPAEALQGAGVAAGGSGR